MLLVVLDDDAGRLKHVPRIVDPTTQIRLLTTATACWSFVCTSRLIDTATTVVLRRVRRDCNAFLFRTCLKIALVIPLTRVILKQVALTTHAFLGLRRTGELALQIAMHYDLSDLWIRHERLGPDNVNHLLGDAFQS